MGSRHPITVYSDHKNLKTFLEEKQLSPRQARWSLFLSEFDFILIHRDGKSSGKPDALSRRPDHRPEGGVEDNADVVLLKPEHFRSLANAQDIGSIGFRDEEEILEEVRRRRTQWDDKVTKGLTEQPDKFKETNGIVEYTLRAYYFI